MYDVPASVTGVTLGTAHPSFPAGRRSRVQTPYGPSSKFPPISSPGEAFPFSYFSRCGQELGFLSPPP